MLSNPLHRFSPYHNLQSPALVPNGHGQQGQSHSNGMDTMNQGAHYGIHQLHHVGASSPHLARSTPQPRQRQHPYGPNGRGSSAASGPVRRRISRACDQCNQLRTKCDGQHPCAHCVEFGLGCEYVRERKKRGKASRKDLAQQAAAQAASAGTNSTSAQKSDSGAESSLASDAPSEVSSNHKKLLKGSDGQRRAAVGDKANRDLSNEAMAQPPGEDSISNIDEMPAQAPHGHENGPMDGDEVNSAAALELNGYANGASGYDRTALGSHMMNSQTYGPSNSNMSNYPEMPYGMQNQGGSSYSNNPAFQLGNSPLGGYGLGAGATSPGWAVSIPSPEAHFQAPPVPQPKFTGGQHLRYPVLEPLIPHLGGIMPISLACDLIELYFASSSSAQMHPMSPYVLGFVFRKRAFLHQTKPRRCQPALLSSILWVAAQTSDAPLLTSVPSARAKTCQKLLELTVGLLKPLIHTPSGETSPAASPAADGAALGGLGVALPGTISMDALSGEQGAFGAAGSLDDVITYIHLATVVSASEYKGASIRWWNAAWSLARELKLGRELPPSPMQSNQNAGDTEDDGLDDHDRKRNNPDFVTEEEREERRRIWWLVYIVDRHLALCYNRPLFLLDIECDGLFQPIDETAWQRGDFGASSTGTTDPTLLNSVPESSSGDGSRVRGVHFECRGHSIFGYFLPLMTILGEIVDLHHARNHPRFGLGFRNAREWDDQAAEITRHLELYEQSLKRFEQQHLVKTQDEKTSPGQHDGDFHGTDIGTPSVHSVHTNSSNRMTESDIQARIVLAYGTHVMHVLYILLAGKWDPINLLDDNDLWISSQGFLTSTGHAVSAAEAINQILEYDPGLEFMPFFFGIYLLQGSFLLLLIADKLQSEASPSVVRACETIVRAHEACVVTLSTEYQRNFSKVMRSALAQVRGRVPEDLNEQHQRRRELLALYRWTGDGTGLAL